jgi:hypothetical protein
MYHSRDQQKVMEMMQAQKESLAVANPLPRDRCLELFKIQQGLQKEMMREMM